MKLTKFCDIPIIIRNVSVTQMPTNNRMDNDEECNKIIIDIILIEEKQSIKNIQILFVDTEDAEELKALVHKKVTATFELQQGESNNLFLINKEEFLNSVLF